MQTLAHCCLLLLLVTPLSNAILIPHITAHNNTEMALMLWLEWVTCCVYTMMMSTQHRNSFARQGCH
jgi:hypothetical protein